MRRGTNRKVRVEGMQASQLPSTIPAPWCKKPTHRHHVCEPRLLQCQLVHLSLHHYDVALSHHVIQAKQHLLCPTNLQQD